MHEHLAELLRQLELNEPPLWAEVARQARAALPGDAWSIWVAPRVTGPGHLRTVLGMAPAPEPNPLALQGAGHAGV